MVFQDQLETN